MICNVWLVLILLIIIIIIGLIVFSQNKNVPATIENFAMPSTPEALSSLINRNNNTINYLVDELSKISPTVGLINYNPETVYQDIGNSFSSNVSTINNVLINRYNTANTQNEVKMDEIEKTLSDLENIVSNMGLSRLSDTKYSKIKSLNNGLELGLVQTPNTFFQDPKTGDNKPGYMVSVNNGCLSVGATDYDVYKCNDKNPKQIFKMEHIINEVAYQNNIDTSLPLDKTNKTNINYPFVMMKSVNNENCLTNNQGNITVQPCYSFVAQRWMPL